MFLHRHQKKKRRVRGGNKGGGRRGREERKEQDEEDEIIARGEAEAGSKVEDWKSRNDSEVRTKGPKKHNAH